MPNKLSNEFVGETLAKELENSGFQINLVIDHGRPWFTAHLKTNEYPFSCFMEKKSKENY